MWVFITRGQIFGENKCARSVKRTILSSIKLFNDNSVVLQGHSWHHCLVKWPTGIRPAAKSLFCLPSSHKGEKASQPSWVKEKTGAQRAVEEGQETVAIKQERRGGGCGSTEFEEEDHFIRMQKSAPLLLDIHSPEVFLWHICPTPI